MGSRTSYRLVFLWASGCVGELLRTKGRKGSCGTFTSPFPVFQPSLPLPPLPFDRQRDDPQGLKSICHPSFPFSISLCFLQLRLSPSFVLARFPFHPPSFALSPSPLPPHPPTPPSRCLAGSFTFGLSTFALKDEAHSFSFVLLF
ncbi:hypothetical protein BDY24DRAFT_397770 [Mrakia frigida]|uniref:uncharacterized protein n=1 Tax=Mrakia frigida TaxID=29902 RepID=UPI003FCC22AA